MGDTNTGADDQKSAAEQGSTATDEKAEQGQQDGGKPADQGEADKNAGNGDQGGEKPKEEKKEEKKPFEDDGKSEPAVRKRSPMTAKDHIIARKERQLQKANAAKAEGKPEEKGADADDDADDDDAFSPEDKDRVSKIVDERLAPIVEERRQAEDDAEVRDYLASNPELAPFEAKVRRFMKHESRKDVPVSTIFLEAAGPDFFMQLGAERARKAAEEAKKGSTGGSGTSRDVSGGTKPVSEMTEDEFRAAQDKVRRGA